MNYYYYETYIERAHVFALIGGATAALAATRCMTEYLLSEAAEAAAAGGVISAATVGAMAGYGLFRLFTYVQGDDKDKLRFSLDGDDTYMRFRGWSSK